MSLSIHTENTWKGTDELVREVEQDPQATPRERELAARIRRICERAKYDLNHEGSMRG